jgi:hypothetical protein
MERDLSSFEEGLDLRTHFRVYKEGKKAESHHLSPVMKFAIPHARGFQVIPDLRQEGGCVSPLCGPLATNS